MKIFPFSNLQLKKHFVFSRAQEQFDVVVIAGDIGGIYLTHKNPFSWARSTWPDKLIVYVAGKHEFYGGDYDVRLENLRKLAKENNVYFLENETLEINGVRFIAATLWTDFNLFGNRAMAMRETDTLIKDWKIRRFERAFSAEDALGLFNKSKQFISTELAKEFQGDTVVITHFGPSGLSIPPKNWCDIDMTPYFCSDLSQLMGPPNLWIHGHTHDNIDYVKNGTRVVSNPHCYNLDSYPENTYFDPDLVVDTARCRLTNSDINLRMIQKVVAIECLLDPKARKAVRDNVRQMQSQGKDIDKVTDWEPKTLNGCINLAKELDALTGPHNSLMINGPFDDLLDPEPIMNVMKMYLSIPRHKKNLYAQRITRYVDINFTHRKRLYRILSANQP